MGVLRRPASSTDYVRARVAATEDGDPVDLSPLDVEMAFIAGDADPEEEDWKAASWDVATVGTTTVYRAKCLIGPDGVIALTAGLYTMHVRVVAPPEDIQRPSGPLRIT